MLKKLSTLFLSLYAITCLVIPVSAQNISYITDEAGLLQSEEITALEEQAAEISSIYGIDSVILTINSLDDLSPQDYADHYYEQHGYGTDGLLFLVSMEERDWYISTYGSTIYALTDYGIQQISEIPVSYFSQGKWFDGFSQFLSSLPIYLDAYETGAPIDGYADYSGDYYHGDQEELLYYEEEFTPSFLFSLLFGTVAAGITIVIMRFSMNTKRVQRGAAAYMKEGSWHLTLHTDLFLYSRVSKTRRQQNKPSGGGSSVHRSSSGSRHGGGGGKF